MRADRLVSLVLLLQERGRLTAADAAAELEVSVATARRDLEALSAAGVPVYAQPGRGGGWQLLGGARTDLTGLTAGEATALFTLIGIGAAATPAQQSAVAKLVRALPATFREDAQRAAAAVHVDAGAWGAQPAAPPPHLAELQAAAIRREVVALDYASKGRQPRRRVVRPHGTIAKAGVWYLAAGTERGPRTLRVDRIQALTRTGELFPDEGFDVAGYWSGQVERLEGHRGSVAATARLPSDLIGVVRTQFGRHFELISNDGRTGVVRVRANLPVALAEQLAGWGNRIEVLAPSEVRAELARIGSELIALYER